MKAAAVKVFFGEVLAEWKKLHFPTRRETYVMLITILVITGLVSVAIAFVDYLTSIVINWLFGI